MAWKKSAIDSRKDEADFMSDLVDGALFFGIPDMFHMLEALLDGDNRRAAYYAHVAGSTHVLWYTAYRLVSAYDMWRHGGKNLMSFHKMMQGKGALAGQAARHPAMLPVYALESMIKQREVWDEIGDPYTGAVHYSGAGGMTGGSMPVVSEPWFTVAETQPGDVGTPTFWDSVRDRFPSF